MRLNRLDLTRYGKFTGFSLDFGPAPSSGPDLHIVYGLNEAGKSTSLSAYLDLLFGIEQQSRYNFLHAYDAMEIGGALELNGQVHELVRIKARGNSLRDTAGRPLNEALLGQALGGIGRDSYATMFSLDDDTLERGGKAILESKGDLGELLFSASAGLAGIGATLSAISEEADAIHRKRARLTQMAELRQRLTELKTQRDAIDTQVTAYRLLVSEEERCHTAYEAAMREQADARQRREDLGRLIAARPLAGEIRRLTEALAPLAERPRPPADWGRELPLLLREETRLVTRRGTADADMERLAGELSGLQVEDAVLAFADRIDDLARHSARFTTAEDDLPKRQQAMIENRVQIAGILASLGRPAEASPEKLVLPAATVGTLRDLIEARSGIDASLKAARRETAAADEALQAAKEEQAAQAALGAPLAPEIGARLTILLAAIRRSEAPARLSLAEKDLQRAEDRLVRQRATLAPFSGDEASLLALAVPDQRAIAAWRQDATALDRRLSSLSDRRTEIGNRIAETGARLASIREQVGAMDEREARRIRAARDEAWIAHRQALDGGTADAFAERMAEDDAAVSARLAQGQDIMEMRRLAQDLAAAEAMAAREEAAFAEAEADSRRLAAELAAALPEGIVPSNGVKPEAQLARIEDWCRRRAEVIAVLDERDGAHHELTALRKDIDKDRKALLAILPDMQADAPLAALIEAGEIQLARDRDGKAARAAIERDLTERQRLLKARRAELAEALAAEADWQARWEAALADTWFAGTGDAAAVRAILDALAHLPGALRERDELIHRIASMERDQQAFTREVHGLLDDLGLPPSDDRPPAIARQLAGRLLAARKADDRRHALGDELARLKQERDEDERATALLAAARGRMTDFFGVTSLEEVAAALDQDRHRSGLEERLEETTARLLAELDAPTLSEALARLDDIDFAEIGREAAELSTRLDHLEIRTREAYAQLTQARDRLAAVGGDDSAARIEAERRLVLLQIEEAAERYLRLKSGLLVAGHALAAYRDRHRSAMMQRASEAFREITRGDYAELAARADRDREMLFGITRDGGSRLASEMSKGTQFQLYLALRLAGYEEFAKARTPVPFIADDIMETFDEPRSEEVLRLFGEMARIGQVIYLTHHRHLCDLALKVVPGAKISTLPYLS